jgi:hypothetical protein
MWSREAARVRLIVQADFFDSLVKPDMHQYKKQWEINDNAGAKMPKNQCA